MNRVAIIRKRVRFLLGFFIAALVLSGLTAFPLQWETETACRLLGAAGDATPEQYTGGTHWMVRVRNGLQDTYAKYPFVAYGTDWLAFAHIVIAVFFFGPLVDPVRNVWVIDAGMIACVLVVVLAMACGPIRGIPFYWRLIDSSFGIFGFLPLWLCRRYVNELISMESSRDKLGST